MTFLILHGLSLLGLLYITAAAWLGNWPLADNDVWAYRMWLSMACLAYPILILSLFKARSFVRNVLLWLLMAFVVGSNYQAMRYDQRKAATQIKEAAMPTNEPNVGLWFRRLNDTNDGVALDAFVQIAALQTKSDGAESEELGFRAKEFSLQQPRKFVQLLHATRQRAGVWKAWQQCIVSELQIESNAMKVRNAYIRFWDGAQSGMGPEFKSSMNAFLAGI